MANENYTMEIQDSEGTFTFDITPKFFPALQFAWKRDGKTVAVTDSAPVEGWLSENDQDVLLTKWNRLRRIAEDGAPTRFTFKKDTSGTIIHSYTRAHIQNLTTVEEGGGFVNHIQFRFNIQEERGVTFPDLVNVTREDSELREIEEDGSVRTTFVRTVSATGEFGDLQSARNFVLPLKPPLQRLIRQDIRDIHFDGTVIATWEFDTTDENPELSGIKLWRERATRSPGQLTHRFYYTVGRDFERKASVLLRGGNRETRIAVTGRIEAYEEAAFPTVQEIIAFWANAAAEAVTGIVIDNPALGAIFPIAFDAEDPTQVTLFGCEYSFALLFGEEDPSVLERPPNVRHVGNQGR